MIKPKHKYRVMAQEYFHSEDHNRENEWECVGETYAVSEKQAINNVRHRMYGDYGMSQNKPLNAECKWENGLHWKAERIA